MIQAIDNRAGRPWSDWAFDNLQLGLLVLDSDSRVVFANQWFLRHAQVEPEDVLQKTLVEAFPQLETSHFSMFLAQALVSGFPMLLSQTLHPAPFPLYMPVAQRSQEKLLRQSIRIIPMGFEAADGLDQRYTLIQISDVTQSVMRERLLKAQASKLQSLANLDVLTGLSNRRVLDDKLASELPTAARSGSSVALVMFDIDFFKQYNDCYGHLAGDDCLRRVAEVLRQVCRRPRDVVVRFGGEEMVAVLPDTDKAGALQVANEVRDRVLDLQIPHSGSTVAEFVTISAGVAVSAPGVVLTPAALLGLADQALYNAKHSGRNAVHCWVTANGIDSLVG